MHTAARIAFMHVKTIAVLLILMLSDLIALIASIPPTRSRIKLIGNSISVNGTITISANDSAPSVGIFRFRYPQNRVGNIFNIVKIILVIIDFLYITHLLNLIYIKIIH